jgi:periplasmic sensor signal transduction histidine kinase
MDGEQAGLSQSLQFRLARAISLAVAAMATVAGILSFRATLDEVHEFQDEILEQAAELLGPESGQATASLPVQGCLQTDDDEEGLIIQRLPALPKDGQDRKDRKQSSVTDTVTKDSRANDGAATSVRPSDATRTSDAKRSSGSRDKDEDDDDDEARCLPLPATLKNGFHAFRHQNLEYRVYVHRLRDGSRIAVSQETRIRDQIARQSALYATLPLLLLVPVLLAVTLMLVRLMLRPLAELSRTVNARQEHDLQPLPKTDLPTELQPFVNAINGLLGRTSAAMESQRRFVADAAHELRSPLAALSLQAERLHAAPMSPEATERLETLQAGIRRSRHLLEQLLLLARAQNARWGQGQGQAAATAASVPTIVAVLPVMRRVLEDLLPLADQKGLNLGISAAPGVTHDAEADERIRVAADEMALYTLLRNLVDNAIRYTPAGGQIDLWVDRHGTEVVMAVQDDGPGIPAEERARVVDPFYRVLGTGESGSGLGLSIVDTLVGNLKGRLRLDDAVGHAHGLRAEVTLPAA